MKQIQKSLILLAVAALVVGLTGCRKKPVGLTPIPGQKTLPPAGDGVSLETCAFALQAARPAQATSTHVRCARRSLVVT